MNNKMPHTPFSTPLSRSARETERRIRNIMSGPKKRPPLPFLLLMFSICIFCGNLVSCQMAEAEEPAPIHTPEEIGNALVEGLEGTYADWTTAPDVTILDVSPDLNRNGIPEEVRLIVPASYSTGQQLEIWEDGKCLLTETGDEAHVGWNAIFLCTLDGEDYLLSYHPYMGQGLAGYGYELYTLEGGAENVVQENELFFEINFGMPTPDGGTVDPDDIFDPDAIAGFMEEVNGLLSHSVQLLNTDKELLSTFEREGRLVDTLFFLYIEPEVFTPDPEASLRENLWNYRDAMVQWMS